MNTENAECTERAITQSVLVCMWHGVAAAVMQPLFMLFITVAGGGVARMCARAVSSL